MEIENNIQEMQPVATDSLGFMATFEDGSQIDTTSDVDEMGVSIGLGALTGDEDQSWGEVQIGWSALQAVVDEFNEMLRQARRAGWTS